MKNAKVIGVDFDDVIVSTNEAMALWHNRLYGTSYQKKDISSWDLTSIWHCTTEEMHKRIDEFYDSFEHAGIMPMDGAVAALGLLGDKELHIITARSKDFLVATQNLAAAHVPFLLDKFNFANLGAGNASVKRTKAEICLEVGVEVFIDDNLDYAHNVASVGIPVLLFNNPWNQTEVLPANVERVFSWKEILEKLL